MQRLDGAFKTFMLKLEKAGEIMAIYGYCRISTAKQSLDRQQRNIQSIYSEAQILKEIYTGKQFAGRSIWEKLMKVIHKGDVIVFDSVSRMSRDAEEGYDLYQKLFQKGIELVFLKEPHINTSTYKKALNNNIQLTGTKTDIILQAVNDYLLELAKEQIKMAFQQSEKEVNDLRQRTKEGLQTAKLEGKSIGQKKGAKLYVKKKEPILKIIMKKSKSFNGHNKDDEVMAILANSTIKVPSGNNGNMKTVSARISKNTYYKYKRELFERYSNI